MAETFAAGDVILYPYRWLREKEQDRSPDGAKDRPCCVVLAIVDARGQDVMFLAAISSKPPVADQVALEVPETERRRAGLGRYPRAWVYVDELNQDRPAVSWYLEPQQPLGAFSRPFLIKIAQAVRSRMRAGRVIRRR